MAKARPGGLYGAGRAGRIREDGWMGRKKPASSGTHLGDAWALGRRYRRLSVRIRKPITMSVVLALVVALTGPTAFAEDPITDPNAPATPRATAAAPGAASPTAPTTTGTVATDRPADTAARATPDHAMLTTNMTKDQLKAAPEFKYAR